MDYTAYILVGPPGSGKSTWCAQHLMTATRPTHIVSSDNIIEEHAAEQGINYSEAFARTDFKLVEIEMYARMSRAIWDKMNLIVDRTNMKVASRRKVLDKIPTTYRRVAVTFEVARQELERRLVERAQWTGKTIPSRVVDGMISGYQPPTLGEFHEVTSGYGVAA
jgi:predicted kinase